MKKNKLKFIWLIPAGLVLVVALFAANSDFSKGALVRLQSSYRNILNVKKDLRGTQNLKAIPNFNDGYRCYVDNLLKIGAFIPNARSVGIADKNVEYVVGLSADDCKKSVLQKSYRFSEYYKTTPEFALVCTDPCNVHDTAFLDAHFEGQQKGINYLKDAVGYLPKRKIEFHSGQDGDCFQGGYGDHPTASADRAHICNAEYYWYLDSQKYPDAKRDLNYERSLVAQTLTIHEPIHQIFWDSEDIAGNVYPDYVIQESFCKGISLMATGVIKDFGDPWLAGIYTINNPPPDGDVNRVNFLLYSLNKRFGFNMGPQVKQFFDLYKNDNTVYATANERVKKLLDKVLGQDTQKSFDDIGIK